jgi:esterase/lipase
MTTTIFIPGAFSTSTCFNYMRDKLNLTSATVEYDVNDGLMTNVIRIHDFILSHKFPEPINIISHSMGGLIAVLLYHRGVEINKLVSMSAPLGGSKTASYAKWWTNNQLLHDLSNKKLYNSIKDAPIKCDNRFFVTTKGIKNDFGIENDCVVSVESQTAIKGIEYHKVNYSHSEILQSEIVTEEIRKFLLMMSY